MRLVRSKALRNQVVANFLPVLLFLALWTIVFCAASALEFTKGVSVWYLPGGLRLAFAVRYGPRFNIPIILIALGFGIPIWLPHAPGAWLLTSLAPAVTYFIGAIFLSNHCAKERPLETSNEAIAFLIVAFAIAAMTGLGSVGAMLALGQIQERQLLETAAAFMLGDLVGMLTVGPLTLLALSKFGRSVVGANKAIEFPAGALKAPTVAILTLAATASVVVVLGQIAPQVARLPYLFIVPILLAALTCDMLMTTLIIALANLAVVLLLKFGQGTVSPLHSQAIMIAFASSGLLLAAFRQEQLRFLSHARASQAALHDLKSPLFGLRLVAERLSGLQSHEGEVKSVTYDIGASVSSVERMARNLFENATFSLSASPFNERDFEIGSLFFALDGHVAAIAREAGVSVAFRQSSVVLRTDPDRLSRILQNLIINAVEHSSVGGVLVGCRPLRDGIRVCVYDTGRGVPAKDLSNIFKPGRSTARQSDRGFGLTFSKLIADQLGMRIGVKSVEGQGSCFSIEVPSKFVVRQRTVRGVA